MFVDYYAVLNLSPSCSAREVRGAFKRFALLYHPDRSDDTQTESFREIKDAYDVLSDPARRYLYDLGYAEMQCARQRELEMMQRQAAAQLQPLRRNVHKNHYIQSENVARTSSRDTAFLDLQTPLSASCHTMPPAATTLRESHEAVESTREASAAARVVASQGSTLGLAGGGCAADVPRGDGIAGTQDGNVECATNVLKQSTASDVRSLPALRRLGSQRLGDDPQARGLERNEQERPRHFRDRYCSVPSLVVPKKTTIEWGLERPRSQQVFTLPREESLCASVVKTWRVFFDLTEAGWGEIGEVELLEKFFRRAHRHNP